LAWPHVGELVFLEIGHHPDLWFSFVHLDVDLETSTLACLDFFKQGVEMTRKRGTCVLLGLPPGEFPVPLFDVVANCITIRGSFVAIARIWWRHSPSRQKGG
jgi:threonine dehydrogenase-like Zn-dependent dehydrogenase